MSDFRFESLLKVKELERDEKKTALLRARAARQEAFARVEECELELVANQREIRTRRTTRAMSSSEARRLNEYHNLLREKKQNAEKELLVCVEDEERKQKELDEIVKEVRILQNLKEKQSERRFEEEKRRSDKEIDELVAQQKSLEQRESRDQ